VMRLVDDTGRLFRAPEVRFSCHEIALDAFGYNVDNRSLMLALEARAAEVVHLVRFEDEAAPEPLKEPGAEADFRVQGVVEADANSACGAIEQAA